MPANISYCNIYSNRNLLGKLGALQPQDKLNPVFIVKNMGPFGNIVSKNMTSCLSKNVPVGVETAEIANDEPISQQIEVTKNPTNTSLRVGMNRGIGDISDSLVGGRMFMKQPKVMDRKRGTGILENVKGAIDLINQGRQIYEDVSNIAEAGTELVTGPIGTWASNLLSEKFNKNPNWREGFPGEKHAIIDTPWGYTRANWLGPGTHVEERLKRGDPSVDGPKGLDAAAKKHDIAYGLARTAEDVRKADNEFLDDLRSVTSSTKMKNFVIGLFEAKKLGEDIGFLDPARFAPDITKEIVGMGLKDQLEKCVQVSKGAGFTGYNPQGSITAENVMGGVGLPNIKDFSKFVKKDLSVPLKQLRSIAMSVPVENISNEEGEETFLPGQQLREQLLGKGFSAENVMMGVGKSGKRKKHKLPRGKKKDQAGGVIGTIASIIAGVVVPELIKFVTKKIKSK